MPVVASHEHRLPPPQSRVHWGLLVAAAIGLFVLFWFVWNRGAVAAFKEEAGPITFFAAMAVLPAVGFPLTPFFVMAGAAFGTSLGLLGSLVGLGLNLALCYWIARSNLRGFIVSLLKRFNYELPNFEERERGSVRFAFLVKATPGVPGFLKNYLLGLVGVPFWVFFAVSMVMTGVYAAALVLLGGSLSRHNLNNTTLAVALILLLGVLVWSARSRSTRVN